MNEEQKPLISIIVPVYNARKYLKECINSIVNQTYTNLDIILIDDGSTDDSGEICDEYAKKEKRIRVFHKNNAGVSSARNMGISQSKAKFLCFVDSDDIILPDYIMYLYELLISNHTDMSACEYVRLTNIEMYKESKNSSCVKVYDKNTALKNMIYKRRITGHSWLKLYKRELLSNIHYNEELEVAEDFDFVYQYLQNVDSISYGSRILYIYRQNEESCMHSNNWRKYEKAWEISNNRLNTIKECNSKLIVAYKTYLFIGALGFYSMSKNWVDADSFKKNLIDAVSEYSRIVAFNREAKAVHRFLGILCFINGHIGCQLCRLMKQKVQLSKAI